jgi:hypothetical protein
VVWFAPNTQEIMAYSHPALGSPQSFASGRPAWWQWRISRSWALATAVTCTFAITFLNRVSEFIYFQF